MIGTVWRVGWLSLVRDRPALVLTFAVPVIFFTVFAALFASMETAGPGPVRVVFVAGSADAAAERWMERLAADPGIRRVAPVPIERDAAVALLAAGEADVVVLLPDDIAERLADPLGGRPRVTLLVDRAHPYAAEVIDGALQATAVFEMLDGLRRSGLVPPGALRGSLVEVETQDLASRGRERPTVSFFAAGIGVMFLLFALSGRAALLIEERESGVLVRLLASRLTLTGYLVGRWLYLATLGFLQLSLMFVWGALVFGLELGGASRLASLSLVTAVASGAAAAFGLLLSVSCRTRAQLNGVAIVVVLVMSALGGSMFPRFLMPETVRTLGLATFNAWALDAYRKVFWYEAPPLALAPQLAVMIAMGAGFFLAALALARRARRSNLG